MTVWWLASGVNINGPSYYEMKKGKFIGQGFQKINDIKKLQDFLTNRQISDYDFLRKAIDAEFEYKYKDDESAKKNAARILCNLLKIQQDDLVVICDGTTVKGMAKIPANPTYEYKQNELYAHRLTNITNWKDWDETKAGIPPNPPNQGIVGIEKLSKDSEKIVKAWQQLA